MSANFEKKLSNKFHDRTNLFNDQVSSNEINKRSFGARKHFSVLTSIDAKRLTFVKSTFEGSIFGAFEFEHSVEAACFIRYAKRLDVNSAW